MYYVYRILDTGSSFAAHFHVTCAHIWISMQPLKNVRDPVQVAFQRKDRTPFLPRETFMAKILRKMISGIQSCDTGLFCGRSDDHPSGKYIVCSTM